MNIYGRNPDCKHNLPVAIKIYLIAITVSTTLPVNSTIFISNRSIEKQHCHIFGFLIEAFSRL